MLFTPDPACPDQRMRSLISNKNIPQTDSKLLSCCSLLMFVLIKSSLTSCPDGLHVLSDDGGQNSPSLFCVKILYEVQLRII